MTELSIEFLSQQASKESPFTPDTKQCRLTEQFLIPQQNALQEELLHLRKQFDAKMTAHNAHYPIGFCKQINDGVYELLNKALLSATTPGLKALSDFCAEGGRIQKVWGNLRNSYFQNALQMGSLYVDVSNDTVVITKPKIDIQPMAQADFHALEDYSCYAQIAENYWQAQAYPNRYLPHLAPLFPLLLRYPSGRWKLHCPYQSLLYTNLLRNFQPAEDFLMASQYHQKTITSTDLKVLTMQLSHANIPYDACSKTPVSNNTLKQIFTQARTQNTHLNATVCQHWLNQANEFNAANRTPLNTPLAI